jgi:NPCBM-associated, NEW3 domain of alpha-galactosidase/Right handed beta helix region
MRRAILAGTGVLAVLGGFAAAASQPANASPPPGKVLYVSPAGASAGSHCTQQAPCSLSGAQQAVRTSLAGGGTGGIAVLLSSGTYRLNAPLRFGPADSGTPGNPVTWEPAPGAHPVISGGTRVTGWNEPDPAKGIWSAKIPSGTATRQVYIDGQAAPVAQEPVSSLGLDLTHWGTSGFTTSGPTAAWFSNLAGEIGPAGVAGVQFVWSPMPPTDWEESECPLAAIASGTITMAQPCWNNLINKAPTVYGGNSSNITPYSLSAGAAPTTIENAYPLLHPGQWYLDQRTSTLYYMPAAGQEMARLDVEVPRLQSLMQVTGTLAEPARDVAFRGLTFTTATWMQPSTDAGFDQVQDNLTVTGASNQGECTFAAGPAGSCPWAAFTQPLANVQLTAARDVTFADDTFTDLGGAGLGVKYGSDGNVIRGNTFTRIASSAIWLGCSGDPDPTDPATDPPSAVIARCSADPASAHDHIGAGEIMTGNTVEDNVIYGDAAGYPGAAGVTLMFTQHTTVSHNDIFGMPYDGITSGAWQGHPDTNLANQNVTTNINSGNTVSDNLFHNNMQAYGDGGDIYTEGHQGITVYNADGTVNRAASFADGTLVTGNVTDTDTPHYSYAVAPDAGSQWLNVTGNVEWNSHYSMSSHWPDAAAPYTLSDKNWYADPDDTPASPGQFGNSPIPETPGPSALPLNVLADAGVQGPYQALEAAVPASIYYSGASPATATTPAEVLVGGTGFTGTTRVFIGGVASPHVRFLSSGFLVADVPACVAPTADVTLQRGMAARLGVQASTGIAQPGRSFQARAALCDPAHLPLPGASVSLSVPAGWTVTPSGPVSLGTVPAGSQAEATFTVTPPGSGLAPGDQRLTAAATFTQPGQSGKQQVTGSGPVQVPYPSLAAGYGNTGISDDTGTADADIDGNGSSFSAQALASAGITPGKALTYDGVTFTWPDVPAGKPDNVVGSGQAIDLSGSGKSLGFLDTSVDGSSTSTGTITYSDGTTQSFTLYAPDWYGSAPYGSNAVIVAPYRNRPGNTQDHTAVNIYEQSVPLQPGKTVEAVTLPNVSSAVAPTSPSLHVFGMAIG